DLLAQDAQLVGQRETGEHGRHSITWSARNSNDGGMVTPIAFVVTSPLGLDKRRLRPTLVATRATPQTQPGGALRWRTTSARESSPKSPLPKSPPSSRRFRRRSCRTANTTRRRKPLSSGASRRASKTSRPP